MKNLGNGDEINAESFEILRRSLIKVSLAASGVHQRIDDSLNQMRKTIRDGGSVEDIRTNVEAMADILREIGDETSLRLRASIHPLDLIDAFLNKKLPDAVADALLNIRNKPPKNAEDMAQAIIKACAKWPAKTSLLSRWMGAKSAANASAENSPLSGDVSALTEPLLKVLHNLRLPENHKQTIKRIQDRLENLHDLTELPDAIGLLAETLLDASSLEQAQFEQFLTQLNARLTKVQQFLDASSSFAQVSREDGQNLQVDMRKHMSELRHSVASAKDLKELQSGIDTRLDGILSRIDQYRGKQEERLQSREQDFIKLREQLRATEDEAARLRANLTEQRHRANTDALTAMPNRHAYNERLTQEYNRWRRYRHKLSLVIGDIDHFKRINDEHGHMAGDAILKQVANILTQGVRESDFVARHGGEEFVILMPETNLVDATKAVNKLRTAICKDPLSVNDIALPVTISFGVAEFDSNDVPTDVYTRADTALYRAKTKGRNMVCCERKANNDSSAEGLNT